MRIRRARTYKVSGDSPVTKTTGILLLAVTVKGAVGATSWKISALTRGAKARKADKANAKGFMLICSLLAFCSLHVLLIYLVEDL